MVSDVNYRRDRFKHSKIENGRVIIEINNELEVFVQISKTDVGFGNDRGRRPKLLQNPNEVFISILDVYFYSIITKTC